MIIEQLKCCFLKTLMMIPIVQMRSQTVTAPLVPVTAAAAAAVVAAAATAAVQ
jgi:hypothetical protein